ncbi:MAG TPA: hypothetical protein VK870_10675 [Ignavibacteriaceae bacterium]|nr:hypothetical protein [Ignavibacteriaceae bacterium]
MKILCLILFCFALFNSGCSSDAQKTELPQLYGKWIWIQSSGGIDGRTITPNENEPAKYLQFVKPDIIESYIGDRLISSRSFKLKKDLSIYSSDSLYFIIDNGSSFPKAIFSLTEKTLSLADNVYDGFGELYNRVDE